MRVAVFVDMDALAVKFDKFRNTGFIHNLPKGALIVSLVDHYTNNVLWLGKVDQHVKGLTDTKAIKKRLDYAATELFKGLP